LLSLELFGQAVPLKDFPRLKGIRGLGLTDHIAYSSFLANRFDYTNTYYDMEPLFDVTEPHEALWGKFDFVTCADVLEHVVPPVDRAVQEIFRLLKPDGFLVGTVPCVAGNTDVQSQEHYADLCRYRVVRLGDAFVLVNRKANGAIEVREDLLFHEGPGLVLEMRQFGLSSLRAALLAAGFRDVHLLREDVPRAGIIFDSEVSQPFVARKAPFALSPHVFQEFIGQWRSLKAQLNYHREQCRLASLSRWVRLGRLLGFGPKLDCFSQGDETGIR
jgi:SAM-dependent methyltransferase